MRKDGYIIGIDPGLTNTGWALTRRFGPVHFIGAGELVQMRDMGAGWSLEDLHASLGMVLHNLTRKSLPEMRPLWAVIEAPPMASGGSWGQLAASNTNLAAGALWGILRPFTEQLLFVAPATWQTRLELPRAPKGLTSHQRKKRNTEAARARLEALSGPAWPIPDSPHAVDAALLALYGRLIWA